MALFTRSILTPPPGFGSREAASFVAQLDDQSARLREDTRGLDAAALAWQPAAGLNTIGMLLAHIAIVEVYWTQVGPLGLATYETESVLSIGVDDDGMPLAAGGLPPAGLQGREIAWFDDLLARARAYTKQSLVGLTDADLDREMLRHRPSGPDHEVNLRWVLYHLVEHLAGHYGQINLLAHQHRLHRAG